MTAKFQLLAALLFLITLPLTKAQNIPSDLKEKPSLLKPATVKGRRISQLHWPIMPTFLAPEVVIEKPRISNLRYTEEAGYTGNLSIKGKVISLAVYRLKSGPKQFHDGYLYVNGEIFRGGRVEVNPLVNNSEEALPTYTPFDTTISSIPFTEGNNVIELVFRDPITGLEGGPSFSVQINVQEDGGDLFEPEITLLDSGSSPYSHQFTFSTKEQISPSERERRFRIAGSGSQTEFKIIGYPNGQGGYLVENAATNEPALFFLLPSKKPFSSTSFHFLADVIRKGPDYPGFTDREMFLVGMSIGWFAQGGDLITSKGDLITDAVSFDFKKGMLSMTFEELGDNAEVEEFRINFPEGYLQQGLTQNAVGDFAELMWQAAHLYRTDDPLKEEVTLGMLTSDYSSFGSEIELSGWTSEFLIKTAEIVDTANVEMANEKPMLHGFCLGSCFAAATRIDLPRPGYAVADEVWRRPLMSDVLRNTMELLGSMPAQRSLSAEEHNLVQEEQSVVGVPEKYQSIWPWISWYYESSAKKSVSDEPKLGDLIPESIKHPIISPAIAVVAILCVFGGGVWLLVVQFSTSLGWGFGQLGANVASCLLFLPGLIVAIVFCCLHWPKARRPFGLQLAGFILVGVSFLFIPEWTRELTE